MVNSKAGPRLRLNQLLRAVVVVGITVVGRFDREAPCFALVAKHPASLVSAGRPIPSQVLLPAAEDVHQSQEPHSSQPPFGMPRTRHESAVDGGRTS